MKPCMLLEACNYASTCSIKNRIYPLKNIFLVVKRPFTKFCDIMLQCPKHKLCFPTDNFTYLQINKSYPCRSWSTNVFEGHLPFQSKPKRVTRISPTRKFGSKNSTWTYRVAIINAKFQICQRRYHQCSKPPNFKSANVATNLTWPNVTQPNPA